MAAGVILCTGSYLSDRSPKPTKDKNSLAPGHVVGHVSLSCAFNTTTTKPLSQSRFSTLPVSCPVLACCWCRQAVRLERWARGHKTQEHATSSVRSSGGVPEKRSRARIVTRTWRGEEEGLLGHPDQPRSVYCCAQVKSSGCFCWETHRSIKA